MLHHNARHYFICILNCSIFHGIYSLTTLFGLINITAPSKKKQSLQNKFLHPDPETKSET